MGIPLDQKKVWMTGKETQLNVDFSAGKDSRDYFFELNTILQISQKLSLILCLSARLWTLPHSKKHTLLRYISGIIQNWDLQSLKPQFCAGLPIRAILENPAKSPDPIGVIIGSETRKRAHSGIFEKGVLSPDHERLYTNIPCEKRCPPNNNEVPWKAF